MSASLKVVEPTATVQPPPRKLGKAGAALWADVLAENDIGDAAGLQLLALAAESLDRAESCRSQIDSDGLVIRTKTGLRDHPALKHETAARALCARLIRQLGLDVEPLRSPGRPPGM